MSCVTDDAKEKLRSGAFREEMTTLFEGSPTGTLNIPSVQTLIARITELEGRVEKLERD